jgi:hypothetical protein
MEVRTAYVEEEFEWESLQVRLLAVPGAWPGDGAAACCWPRPAAGAAARQQTRGHLLGAAPLPAALHLAPPPPPAPCPALQRLAVRDTQEGNKKLMVARAMASLMATPGEGQALGRGLGSTAGSPMGSVDGQ